MNNTHNLSMLLFLVLISQTCCMDQQRPAQFALGSQQNSSPSLRASTSLREMLAAGQREHPLLSKDKREENIALIKSIGAAHARKVLLAAAGSVCALNVAKDLVFFGVWGTETLKPLTPLIPPNHSLPLQSCKPICYQSGCCGPWCPDFTSCGPIVCTNQTTCDSEPPSIMTSLELPTSIATSFNLTMMLLSTIALLCNNCSTRQSREQLNELLQELSKTAPCTTQDIETGAPESEDKQLLRTDAILTEKQVENLELIASLGAHNSAPKMWTLLALLFGANAAKDFATQQLFGFDTQTIEIPLNNSTQTNSTLNGLGTASTASLGANCAGCVASCFGAIYSACKGSQEKRKVEKLLKKLDSLANAESEV